MLLIRRAVVSSLSIKQEIVGSNTTIPLNFFSAILVKTFRETPAASHTGCWSASVTPEVNLKNPLHTGEKAHK